MPHIEVDNLDVLVLKKLVLINYALYESLSDQQAKREQLALAQTLNAITLRADLALKSPPRRQGAEL